MLTGALILPACPLRLFVPQPRAPSRRPPRRADLWELVWNAPIIRLYFISVRACRSAAAGAALVNKLAVRGGNEREELASHASWKKKQKNRQSTGLSTVTALHGLASSTFTRASVGFRLICSPQRSENPFPSSLPGTYLPRSKYSR